MNSIRRLTLSALSPSLLALTGCDHDDFIDPGAEIQITFERLGSLRCRFAEPAGKLLPSRCFGIVIRDQAVPFAVLQRKAGKSLCRSDF